MNTRTPALPVVALLLSALPAAARQEPAEASAEAALPPARSVIDRYVEVTGFVAATESVSSMRVSGSIGIPAMSIDGVYDRWQAKPHKFLMDAELAGMGSQLQGFDGEVAWSSHPMMGFSVLDGEQRLQQVARSRFDAITRPSAAYESIRTVGREVFEGTDCYKLELVLRPAEGMDVESTRKLRTGSEYYAVESGLLIGTESLRASPQGTGAVVTVFSDHKELGGQKLPSKAVQKMGGMEIEITIEKVEYDTATPETFALPEEIRSKVEKKVEKTDG